MTLAAFPVLIREKHLDTFGHVNNAVYLELYEEARWEIITAGGFGLADIRRMKVGPVVLEANVKFLKELRLREDISITTEIMSYEGKIGKMLQKMIKSDGSTASEAVFVFGLFDLSARKLIDPTPEWKAAIGIT